MKLTIQEIHEKAEAAFFIQENDMKNRFMNAYERSRAERILFLLRDIMEGTA